MKTFSLIALFLFFANCDGKLHTKKEADAIAEDIVIDSIVVKKSERLLIVFSNKKEIKTYEIALGQNPVGKKHFEGDMKTPEGLYFIDTKNANSKYYKNLNVSYPNKEDIKYAAAQNKKPGGDIKIHGLPKNCKEETYTLSDWTHGCIGLTNSEIDELYQHIKSGSPILILP